MLKPFAYFWFGLSIILGNIMSKVLVSIIYILIVIPFGLLMKAVNKDAMKLNEFKKDKTSLFIKTTFIQHKTLSTHINIKEKLMDILFDL